MSNPATRQQLVDYCLRQLGHPVIEINIDDDQLEDCIDDAFSFYRDYHYDATELVYLKQQITPSTLQITGANAASFTNGEIITGSTSGAKATVFSNQAANKIDVFNTTGTFTAAETISGSVSGTSATFSSLTKGVYDNEYVSLDDSIFGVNKILQLSNRTAGTGMFDVRYQLMLNNIQSLTNTDIIYYNQLKTHINLINDLLTGQKPIRFNRHMNRLYIDLNWDEDVEVNEYIIIEAYKILDPNTFTDVYNDTWLKRYATALIKRLWGVNLKKFEGVQLPGGVTLNGQIIYNEAIEEITRLEEEVKSTWQLPVDMFVG